MTQAVQISNPIEAALIKGDLSGLTVDQRLSYYKNVCESVGLNTLTQPFSYIVLNQKLVLYANKAATDQLRKIHNLSITIPSRELLGDVYVVTARAKDNLNREDESTGAVCITGLKGEALANAYMKAETKAKRRVTLSVCGLGILDESEVDSIPEEKKAAPPVSVAPVKEKPALESPAATPVAKPIPKPEDFKSAHDPGEFMMTFGQWNGKRLKELDIYQLNGYYAYLTKPKEIGDKPTSARTLAALEAIEKFLDERQRPVVTQQ